MGALCSGDTRRVGVRNGHLARHTNYAVIDDGVVSYYNNPHEIHPQHLCGGDCGGWYLVCIVGTRDGSLGIPITGAGRVGSAVRFRKPCCDADGESIDETDRDPDSNADSNADAFNGGRYFYGSSGRYPQLTVQLLQYH